VRDLCANFPPEYHRKIDEERGYPEAFVDALTKAGWLAAMIRKYGGSGLGLTEASVFMEEINRSAGNSGACHGQMYNVTEPTTRTDTKGPSITKVNCRFGEA
jgi:acyl-CoA dehydrogenase